MGKTIGGVADPVQIEIPYHLKLRGHEVQILIPTFSKETDFYFKRPLKIHFLPTVPIFTTFSFWLILFFSLPFKSKNFDIVVVDWLSFLGTISTKIFSKAKIVLDVRSPPVETKQFRGLLSKIIFNPIMFLSKYFTDGITVITSLLKNNICHDFKINPNMVGIWESGVDLSSFHPESFKSAGLKLRKSMKIDNRFVVMYHGVFTHTRGLQETIMAFNLLKSTHPDIVLLLLGQGEAKNELLKLISIHELQSSIFVLDPVPYHIIPKYIGMCDIGIVPLPNNKWWRVSSPLKFVEYLAMEKPVIATRIPFHVINLRNSEGGILIENNEPQQIQKAIIHLYNNKFLLKEMGSKGRKIASQYTWENLAEKFETFIKSLPS